MRRVGTFADACDTCKHVVDYFDLIWDDAEELRRLAQLSHPRIVVDTSGLSPKATELANTLATTIQDLDDDTIDWVLAEIRGRHAPLRGPTY